MIAGSKLLARKPAIARSRKSGTCLAGIAEASAGGQSHIEAVFRLARKPAETTAVLAGGERQAGHARRIQQAIDAPEDLTL
jgi:hypothetical protein